MAKITPYTQTKAFQYQPLGLEAFAQPLAQMQQSLDITKSAIQDTDFEMDALSPDDPAAKMKIQQYKSTRDELLENLLKTNNYSDAAVKIKKLNKLYNKDSERAAYETNKAKYLESKEEMKRRLKEGEIMQYQYDAWDFRARNKYAEEGGANFDPTTGDYNPIDVSPLGTNLEEEIYKLAVKWGEANPANIYETFVNKFGVDHLDPSTIANLKQKWKGNSSQEIQRDLYNLIGSSDRFQNFWKESGELDYYTTTRKQYGANPYSAEGQENLDKFNLEQINRRREYYENSKAGVKDKESLKEINNLQTKLEGYISEAEKKGTLNQLAESLYIEDYMQARMDAISGGVGDLLDMEEITYSTVGTNEEGKEAKEKLDKIKDRKIHTKVSGLATDEARLVPTPTGGYTTTNIVNDIYPVGMTSMGMNRVEQINETLRENVDLKNITQGKSKAPGGNLYSEIGMNIANAELSPMLKDMDEETRKSYTTDFSNAIAKVAQVGDGVGTLLDERNKANLAVNNLDNQISIIRKEYDKAVTAEDKEKLKAELKTLTEEQKVNLVAAQNEEQDIIEFINGAVNTGDKEIIKLFNDNDKNYIKTATALKEANYSKLKAFNRKLKEVEEGTGSLGNQDMWYIDKDNQIYFNNFKYNNPESEESRIAYNRLYEEFNNVYENEDAYIKGNNGMGFNPSQLDPNSGVRNTFRNMDEASLYPEGTQPSVETFTANLKDKKAGTKAIMDKAIETNFSELKPVGAKSWYDFYSERYTPRSVKPTAVMITEEVLNYVPGIKIATKGQSEGEGGILGNNPLTAAGVEVFVTDPTIGPTPKITKESISANPIVGFDYKAYGKEDISYLGNIKKVTYETEKGQEEEKRADDLVFAVNNTITEDADILARIKERVNQMKSGVNIKKGEQNINYSYDNIIKAFGDSADEQWAGTLKRDLINSYKASNPATAYLGYEGSSLNPAADAASSLEKDFIDIEKSIASRGELDDDSLAAYDNAVNNFSHIFLRTDFQDRYLKYLGKAQTLMNNLKGDTDFVDLTAEAANYYEEEERTLPEDITLSDGSIIKAGEKVEGLRSYGLSYVLEKGRDGERHMEAKVTEFFTPIIGGNIDIKGQFQLSPSTQYPLSGNITPEELFSLEFKFGIGSQDEAVYSNKDRIVPVMFR